MAVKRGRRIFSLGGSAALICVALAAAAPAHATYPGKNGLIAYGRLGSDNRARGIWAVNPYNGRKQRLVGGDVYDPAYSANGRRLAYRRRGHAQGIFVARADGSHAQRVTDQDDKHPAFSPSGKRVAFDRHQSGLGPASFTIFSTRLDGTHSHRVAYGRDPVYSPNGKWLAYMSGGTGRSPTPTSIHIVRPGGSGDITIFTAATDDFVTDLDWAPDSARIAFHSLQQGLVTMNPDGSNQQALGAYPAPVSYSPDGQWLAYVYGKGREIWEVPAGGGTTGGDIQNVLAVIGSLAWQPQPEQARGDERLGRKLLPAPSTR
jgi:hypothetical protein